VWGMLLLTTEDDTVLSLSGHVFRYVSSRVNQSSRVVEDKDGKNGDG
jgi:hypothetical protein